MLEENKDKQKIFLNFLMTVANSVGPSACRSVGFHIDDIALQTHGPSRAAIIHDLVSAADALKAGFDSVHLRLAEQKARLVASSNALGSQTAAALGDLTAPSVYAAPHLGIDFTSGKHQRHHQATATRRARRAKAQARSSRIRRLAVVKRKPRARLWNTAGKSVFTYGCEVHGFTPQDISFLRARARQAHGAPRGASHGAAQGASPGGCPWGTHGAPVGAPIEDPWGCPMPPLRPPMGPPWGPRGGGA